MKITDGKKTVKITMKVWQGSNWSPSFENDFFEAGCLPYDEETDTYTVQDVDYCVDQANEWQAGIGDYQDDFEGEPGHRPEDRGVWVDEIE